MEVICDIETDGLDAKNIWLIVCKEFETGDVHVFYPWKEDSLAAFHQYSERVSIWIGHNFTGFDAPVLNRLLGLVIPLSRIRDTLIVSRLLDARDLKAHSIAAHGGRLGHAKQHADHDDWSRWSPELEERCLSDVEINFLLYKELRKYFLSPRWQPAIETEQFINSLCSVLSKNGFSFDLEKALVLKDTIDKELKEIDKELKDIFSLKVSFLREVTPRETKHGTINRASIPRSLGQDYTPYHPGSPFSMIEYVEFNPASSTQRVERLNEAGWRPYEKTKGHKVAEKALRKLQRKRRKAPHDFAEIKELEEKLVRYDTYGWTVSEKNLETLPETAPEGVRKLVRRLLLASRSSTLQSWMDAVRPSYEVLEGDYENEEKYCRCQSGSGGGIESVELANGSRVPCVSEPVRPRSDRLDSLQPGDEGNVVSRCEKLQSRDHVSGQLDEVAGVFDTGAENPRSETARCESCGKRLLHRVIKDYRVHGSFNHIGSWPHRMSHDKPNMGNVPKYNAKRPETTPYSDQMRALWRVPDNRLLVGVDAESIQLRIFGHYIEDPEFIKALCEGNKEDGTDPHSVNQRALGRPCKSRDDAKTFIYAWLLGAGTDQVSRILGCTFEEAKEAGENFLDRYPGLRYLKEKVIPVDAERGYFTGFDGRLVKIWGEDVDERRHFCLAGYLQNGESVIMKRAVQIWYPKLEKEGIPFWWVNFVHDEWQTETIEDIEIAKYVARTQADAIRQVGIDLRLRCPFAGSWFSEHGVAINPERPKERWAIGKNWMVTH